MKKIAEILLKIITGIIKRLFFFIMDVINWDFPAILLLATVKHYKDDEHRARIEKSNTYRKITKLFKSKKIEGEFITPKQAEAEKPNKK